MLRCRGYRSVGTLGQIGFDSFRIVPPGRVGPLGFISRRRTPRDHIRSRHRASSICWLARSPGCTTDCYLVSRTSNSDVHTAWGRLLKRGYARLMPAPGSSLADRWFSLQSDSTSSVRRRSSRRCSKCSHQNDDDSKTTDGRFARAPFPALSRQTSSPSRSRGVRRARGGPGPDLKG
jgi:hypothetical protein